MSASNELPPLHEPVVVERLPPCGIAFAIDAGQQERAIIARELELEELASLTFEGRVEPVATSGLVAVRGRLGARLAQLCVVTLEPVAAQLEVEVERLFDPTAPADPPGGAGDEAELELDALDVEPLAGGTLDLGAIAVEELAVGLDPYPRSAEADSALASLLPPQEEAHPFATLARLRRRPTEP